MCRPATAILISGKARADEQHVSIQSCVDHFIRSDHEYFRDGLPAGEVRVRIVTSTILIILGAWALMPQYFTPAAHGDRHRHIILAYCKMRRGIAPPTDDMFPMSLADLITGSGLLPHALESGPALGSLNRPASLDVQRPDEFKLHLLGDFESLSIDPKRLNAYRMVVIGGVRLRWTDNISRHLLLSEHGGIIYLELFALPCAIDRGAEYVLERVGIPISLAQDIKNSYANLFNPVSPTRLHRWFSSILAARYWCWCLGCSSHRLKVREFRELKARNNGGGRAGGHLRKVPFDPLLEQLSKEKAVPWDPTEFPNLWPRLLTLEEHMNKSRPWSFWVLFRDNRDTLQYWTFLYVVLQLVGTISH